MDLLFKIFICFIAGAGAGIGTGFAGMSAAAIISPLLITFLDIPAYEAVGIGLISDVLASAISAIIYKRSGNLNIKECFPMMISVLAMTILGSFVSNYLPEQTMTGTAQVAMFIVGLRFIIKPILNTREDLDKVPKKVRIIESIFGGIIVGFICGFVGAGGGMMMLFVLTMCLGYPMHLAVGTSVYIMTFTALTGGVSHFIIGEMPDITTMLLCIVFTLIWARIASFFANKANEKVLNRVVGIVMIISSIIVLLFDYII